RETPLCFDGARALTADELAFDQEGGLCLRLGLAGRDPCGWRATLSTAVVEFAAQGAHEAEDFWEPVHAKNGH
ncbi:2'-deoxycytidine 5'-triphosphate deaminase, partial [Klebsiella pneumoniae]|nr:2'-deoxycytidine 5'-triphosphate deaminase [Klebsiella pneumoniae]